MDTLKGFLGVLHSIDDDETENALPALPSKTFSSIPGRNHISGKYNTGTQNMKGLSNQTGYTDCNA
ncbi:unnamed protein product [Lupinus luteus]|uniref:Uncharacterized protein n=1 Tax=Lupinus luteus TaxID=3873 RepID=A0AAV1XUY9_LUPLU